MRGGVAVSDGEEDPVEDLAAVVASGDRRRTLVAVRDKLGRELEAAHGRDAVMIAERLLAVIRELDSLPGSGGETRLDRIADAIPDELTQRREARRSDAAGS